MTQRIGAPRSPASDTKITSRHLLHATFSLPSASSLPFQVATLRAKPPSQAANLPLATGRRPPRCLPIDYTNLRSVLQA